MPSQLSGASAVAIQVYQALYGRAPSNALLNAYRDQASPNPQQTSAAAASAFAADLASGFQTTSDAALALQVLNNVNITAATVTAPGSYTTLLSALTQAFTGFGPSARGQIILNVTNLLTKLEGDATYGAAATGFNNRAYADFVYASEPNNTSPGVPNIELSTFNLTGRAGESLQGTAGDDLIIAAIFDNQNSLQSGDKVAGGAGIDRLVADMGESQRFAVTPETTGVEQVAIRAQSRTVDSGDNNVSGLGLVDIDAQRMVGVNQWESNNSRADVIIEDVRILANQITKDITIALIETDPGHVDFGVYFDQLSLRSQSNTTSVLSIEILDTRSAALGTGPLKDNPYDSFAFLIGTTPIIVKSAAIDNALTYADLRAAIDAQITVLKATQPLLANFSVTLGAEFTRFDTQNGTAVKGTAIVLTDTGGGVLSVNPTAGFATPSGVVPPDSGLHTRISSVATSSTDKVTSKIILDDVGRGSTSGDLVIGGLSTGASSTSRGVERFEIRVDDNSKLETINSTNNTLQEVVITQGLTTSNSFAYQATVKDKGNLTVNGVSGLNGGNVTLPLVAVGVPVTSGAGQATTIDPQTVAFGNVPLPGSAAQTARNYGFSDVRLLDGSAMTGQLAFSAEVTSASIAKYMNLRDIGALPAADNIAFAYSGGSNNDAMFMTLDAGVAGSRSTFVSGREDFTFTANGGAGNDSITLNVAPGQLGGAGQAWYTNQKLNANITVNGGDGNDTIRTPGAGDKTINGDAGDDNIYTDNSGALLATVDVSFNNVNFLAGGTAFAAAVTNASTAAAAYTAAAAAELAAAQAAVVAANTTDATVAAQQVVKLAVLDAFTPNTLPTGTILTHTNIAAQTNAALAPAGTLNGITTAQKIALDTAYGVITAAVVTDPITLNTLPTVAYTFATTPDVLTAAEFAAGNLKLAEFVNAARAALATATASDANAALNAAGALVAGTQAGLVDNTQLVLLNATSAVNRVVDSSVGTTAGTQTNVNNLAALINALVVGATDTQVVAAINAAVANGSITGGGTQDLALYNAATATNGSPAASMDATDFAAVTAILAPLANTYANANTTALAALALATVTNAGGTAGVNGVSQAAAAAAGSPVNGDGQNAAPIFGGGLGTARDAIGSVEANNAFVAATTAATVANANLAAVQGINGALVALKAAFGTGATDAQVNIAVTNAAFATNAALTAPNVTLALATTDPLFGGLFGGAGAALTGLAGVGAGAATTTAIEDLAFDTGTNLLNNTVQAGSVDSLIITNNFNVDRLAIVATNATALVTATQIASAAALAATAAGNVVNNPQAISAVIAVPRAVFVVNTANQFALTTGATTATSGYNLLTNDERNLADLKSGANDTYNLFQSKLQVSFKGIDSVVTLVDSTAYKTSDLQINQAIKNAINNDPVLSKLLSANDGPANTLVITSLIDGAMVTTDLVMTLTAPLAGTLSAADITAAATAYGFVGTATEGNLIGAAGFMTLAKALFDTNGNYVTQFAETGAGGGNLPTTGRNSVTSTDNTITGGPGNDVIVLSTTAYTAVNDPSNLSSSNEKIVYSGTFGNDTIVNFAATGAGIDTLDFKALLGGASASFGNFINDKSIVVAAPTALGVTVKTAAEIALLFTDAGAAAPAAINHIYVAVDSTNIGSVWLVADAVGAANVTATLVGSIDLALTTWGSLTAANFA